MKYLESFYNNDEDEDLIQFGLRSDDLKWYFTDVIDE